MYRPSIHAARDSFFGLRSLLGIYAFIMIRSFSSKDATEIAGLTHLRLCCLFSAVALSSCGGVVSSVDPFTSEAPGDLHAFRVKENYDAVHSAAGRDAWLFKIVARCVESDGTIDLYESCGRSSSNVKYYFFRKYRERFRGGRGYLWPLIDTWKKERARKRILNGSGRGTGKIGSGTRVVYAQNGKKRLPYPYQSAEITVQKPHFGRMFTYNHSMSKWIHGTSRLDGVEAEPLELPPLTMKEVWNIALKEGAPSNAVAHIEYSHRGYSFEIRDRVKRVDASGHSRIESHRIFLMKLDPAGHLLKKVVPESASGS